MKKFIEKILVKLENPKDWETSLLSIRCKSDPRIEIFGDCFFFLKLWDTSRHGNHYRFSFKERLKIYPRWKRAYKFAYKKIGDEQNWDEYLS